MSGGVHFAGGLYILSGLTQGSFFIKRNKLLQEWKSETFSETEEFVIEISNRLKKRFCVE